MKKLKTLRTSFDIVGALPHLLGFRPRDSLVLVTASRTEEGTVLMGASSRWDFDTALAERWNDEHTAYVVDTVLTSSPDPLDAIVPVVFSEVYAVALGLDGGEGDPGLRDLIDAPVHALCEAFVRAGVHVAEPLWASAEFHGSVLDPDVVHTRATADESQAAVSMIFEGSQVVEDFDAAVRFAPADLSLVDEAAALRGRGHAAEDLVWAVVTDVLRLYDEVDFVPGRFRPSPLGLLGVEHMCEELWSRDALQMILGFDHPAFHPEDLRVLSASEFLPLAREAAGSDESVRSMVGLSPLPPDFDLLGRSVDYLRSLVPLVRSGIRPAVLAVLAWMEWARMRNSFAEWYAAESLALDPDYRLALLVRDAVNAGVTPGWLAGPACILGRTG